MNFKCTKCNGTFTEIDPCCACGACKVKHTLKGFQINGSFTWDQEDDVLRRDES